MFGDAVDNTSGYKSGWEREALGGIVERYSLEEFDLGVLVTMLCRRLE